MSWSQTYDTASPAGTDDPSEADDRIRETKAAIQERLAVDHKFSLTGTEVSATDSGEHTKITFNVTISDPTQVAGKSHLYMKDDELFYQDDTNTTKQLTNAGALNVAGAELLGILANDTYFTAVNSAGSGTVNLIKAGINDLATLPNGTEMASSAAPVEDEAVVNKKYADTKEAILATQATASIFGTRTFNDTTPAALVQGTVYKAECDGFLTVSSAGGDGTQFTVYIEQGDATPDVVVGLVEFNANYDSASTFTIIKDDYVTLTRTLGSAAIDYMSFVPIGTGGLVAQ